MGHTLFEAPEAYTLRLNELRSRPDFDQSRAELLLQVELGLSLMEHLGLGDEPVTGVWVLLSGMPIRHPRLDRLSAADRRMIANARQIVPLSSRFAWVAALRRYIQQIPIEWRNYDFDSHNLDSQIIDAAGRSRRSMHQELYHQCLTATLTPRRIERQPVQADTDYLFDAQLDGDIVPVRVRFAPDYVSELSRLPEKWFTSPRAREPFTVDIERLKAIAELLDARELALAQRYLKDVSSQSSWVHRLRTVIYRPVQADGSVTGDQVDTFVINGFHHVVGMVASGKSTLSLLIAAQIIHDRPDKRITLVVGDTQTALRLANQINWWFRDDPENDEPVAVPLIGRSTRDTHLRTFTVSRDYLDHRNRGQSHWGERWLGTLCALQALIPGDIITSELRGQLLTPGTEPCQSLRKVPNRQTRRGGSTGRAHLCPFFARCPSQQTYRDMPGAQVWITTPGAMAMSGLPRHLETRAIKLGELVYEQSDIVVFDEAETVAGWFDDVYAEEVPLTNSYDGVFDRIGEQTEVYMRTDRVAPPSTQRWVNAQRDAQRSISATLMLLDERWGHQILRDWVRNGSFTPNALFYGLARRIAGLKEREPRGVSPDVIRANERRIEPILRVFDALLDDDGVVLSRGVPRRREQEPLYALAQLMQSIAQAGDTSNDDDIHRSCKRWIDRFFSESEWRVKDGKAAPFYPEITQRQADPPAVNGSSNEEVVDTLETLARRLQFALTVALLDRHTRIVFYEWHSRPSVIEGEQPHRRMPGAMLDILPLPLTGRQFGTYFSQGSRLDDGSRRTNNVLSLFAYTNIGRWYILNFHRLFTDFDGVQGPNVLALSGTSYLPDSTQFHLGRPHGILLPEKQAIEAISQSMFAFIPHLSSSTGKPIRISGQPQRQRMGVFREMARALVGNNGAGHLGQTLLEIQQRACVDPKHWDDRARLLLLVNSYDQARWAADEIRQCWPSMRERVYHLDRTLSQVAEDTAVLRGDIFRKRGVITLADIETFAQTDGCILVAPMNAIGRGFNTLNNWTLAEIGENLG